MYPTLIVAIIGAVPQYYQWAIGAGLGLSPFADVRDARDQLAAWERNHECLGEIERITPASLTNYRIELKPCPATGDILVTLTPLRGTDAPVDRWIITRNLFGVAERHAAVPSAVAQPAGGAEGGPRPERVLDMRMHGVTVIRRVELSDHSCVDETIDGRTGRRLRSQPAPCQRF